MSLAIGVRRHRRADAPVGLGRACGSVPWGRGRRHKEREPVFPDQSSGVILQPDGLQQACPHPSAPSYILSILVLLLPPSPPPPFPNVPSAIPAPHTTVTQYNNHISVLLLPSLHSTRLHHLKFFIFIFITARQAAELLQHPFFVYISLTLPLISSTRLLSVPFRRSLAPPLFPSIFTRSASIHLLPCGGYRFGSVCSLNGKRCSRHSSRIRGGAPGLPIKGDPHRPTTLRLTPDSGLTGWPASGFCM